MTDQDQIEAVLEDYRAAVAAKDVDAFVALYDPDIEVFDLWGRWRYRGVDEVREMASGWFGSLGEDTVSVDFADSAMTVGTEVAGVHAFVTFAGVSANGEQLRAMTNRLTWVLRKSAGGWRITHEHTSAPVDPDTSKVILQRP